MMRFIELKLSETDTSFRAEGGRPVFFSKKNFCFSPIKRGAAVSNIIKAVPEAHPVRPLVRSGNMDFLFLGGSAAGPYAHPCGTGKGILCSWAAAPPGHTPARTEREKGSFVPAICFMPLSGTRKNNCLSLRSVLTHKQRFTGAGRKNKRMLPVACFHP